MLFKYESYYWTQHGVSAVGDWGFANMLPVWWAFKATTKSNPVYIFNISVASFKSQKLIKTTLSPGLTVIHQFAAAAPFTQRI